MLEVATAVKNYLKVSLGILIAFFVQKTGVELRMGVRRSASKLQ